MDGVQILVVVLVFVAVNYLAVLRYKFRIQKFLRRAEVDAGGRRRSSYLGPAEQGRLLTVLAGGESDGELDRESEALVQTANLDPPVVISSLDLNRSL